jgi:hypothetical protein
MGKRNHKKTPTPSQEGLHDDDDDDVLKNADALLHGDNDDDAARVQRGVRGVKGVKLIGF